MKIRPLVLLLIAAALSPGRAGAQGVQRERRIVAGVPIEIVRARLGKGVRVRPALAQNRIGRAESLAAIVARGGGVAGVTGAYFDTRTSLPVGDVAIDGRLVHFAGRGAALCVTPTKRGETIAFRDSDGIGHHTDWGGARDVLAGGMWLVRGGSLAISPRRQGFRDAGLFRATARTAVALDGAGNLLLLATRADVTLLTWANALRTLGVRDAIGYDGGSSAGLVYRGVSVVRPGRNVATAVVIYEGRGAEDAGERKPARRPTRRKDRAIAADAPRAHDLGITNVR